MRNKRAGKAAAALAMGIVVAAGLVAVGVKESGPSLTYHELLVLAGDKTQAASAKQDLEAASGLPEAIGEEAVAVSKLKEELEEIDAENSASSEAVPEEMPESEAAASEESASAESTAPAASSASEAAASSVPSSAAESHAVSEAASAPSSTAASSAPTAEELCDRQVAEYIRQIEQLQARSEKRLYSIMLSAYSEYMSHPVEERNLVTKVSAVLSKSGELTAAQNQCDAEFAQIMAAMRKTLRENGRDESIADEAEKTYKQKKNALIKELTSQAYSGGDGSGQSGKWLAEHADGEVQGGGHDDGDARGHHDALDVGVGQAGFAQRHHDAERGEDADEAHKIGLFGGKHCLLHLIRPSPLRSCP